MHPYYPFSSPPPALLARRPLVAQLLESLARKHVSIVARAKYGKTVLIHALANEAQSKGAFADVVRWDLRHFMPTDDSAFFARFAEILGEQLTAFGSDPAEIFKDVRGRTAADISSFFELMAGTGKTVLIAMDGLDGPLSCESLSKNVWDNMCAIADKQAVRLVVTSRYRLREHLQNRESRTSDFFRRFDDPPTSLGAFTGAEIDEFVGPLEKLRGLERGAVSELRRQTGGVPVLCALLAKALAEGDRSPIAPEVVRSAGESLSSSDTDVLPDAWNAALPEEQSAFAELLEQGVLRPSQSKIAEALVRLGFAEKTGVKIEGSCEVIQRFSKSQHLALRSVDTLFAAQADFDRNIQAVASLRGRQLSVRDADLRAFLENAFRERKNPKVFLSTIRNIVEHSLELVWAIESPDDSTPKYQSDAGLRFLMKNNPKLPGDSMGRIIALGFLTEDRSGIVPKTANRRIYCLLNALKGYGDFGQHQSGALVREAFAAVVCLTVAELAVEMTEVGF